MSDSQQVAQHYSNPAAGRAKMAALWLYLVVAATVLNSLILFRYSHFVNFLIGLSITQFIDAVFVGMQLEPPGAPWWYTAVPALVLDAPFVIFVLVLAMKVSRQRRRAAGFAFWIYAIDTFVVALTFAGAVVMLHTPIWPLAWQDAGFIVRGVGLWLLFRAWRGLINTSVSA
jgi:hypothetical protein